MSLVSFDMLPDRARLWAFTSGTELSAPQREAVENGVREFLSGWAAHGAPLTAGFSLLHNRFLLVGVDQDQTAPSGCSIDAMKRYLKGLREQTGIDFPDAPDCCYREGNDIICVDRAEFRALAKAGEANTETIVFDLTVPTVGDLRSGAFETTAGSTWHAKAFPLATGAGIA